MTQEDKTGILARRAMVAASWQRCEADYHLDPSEARLRDLLSNPELRFHCDRTGPLLHAAVPEMKRLHGLVHELGFSVLLADPKGVVIARESAPSSEKGCKRWHLWTGAVWDEELEGTNGVGTCLAEERPAVVAQGQHWRWCFHALTCLAVPLFDTNGHLAGALDMSASTGRNLSGCTGLLLTALMEAAQRIEHDLFRDRYGGRTIVTLGKSQFSSTPLVALGDDSRILGATRAARAQMGWADQDIAELPSLMEIFEGSDRSAFQNAESHVVRSALAATSGNVTAAARMLGISRSTLHRKINLLDLH